MEVAFHFFLFFFLFSFLAKSAEVKPLQLLPAKKIFEIEIANPKALVNCSDLLWTYSEKDRKILGLSLNTGEVLSQTPTTIGVQDISCFQGKTLILSSDRTQQRIFELNKKELKKTSSNLTNDWISRLSCQKEKCWAISKKIFSSTDLKNWKIEKIPQVTDLKKETFNPEKNPFEDWQSSLNLAEAGYHDLTVSPDGNLALLDSFHGLVASQYQNQWWKWGQYGVWEGSILLPKKIKYLSNHVLAVADNGLKAIFLFTREGRYLGALSHERNYILSVDFVSGLESIKGRIFIADFVKNKIFAMDIQSLDSMTPEAEGIQFRQNLFRYHSVQQDYVAPVCLNCHDGMVINHLKVFTEKKNKHPISCTSCHDQHHTKKAKYNLLKSEYDLCLSCHSANSIPETNHVWKHGKKGGSCLDCHSSHSGNEKLLTKQPPQLCMECHKNQNISHREVKDLLRNERAKGLSFLDGKINCLTCHQTHENWRQGGFIKDRDQVRIFCASCHGQKTDRVYKDFHKILNAKGAKK